MPSLWQLQLVVCRIRSAVSLCTCSKSSASPSSACCSLGSSHSAHARRGALAICRAWATPNVCSFIQALQGIILPDLFSGLNLGAGIHHLGGLLPPVWWCVRSQASVIPVIHFTPLAFRREDGIRNGPTP